MIFLTLGWMLLCDKYAGSSSLVGLDFLHSCGVMLSLTVELIPLPSQDTLLISSTRASAKAPLHLHSQLRDHPLPNIKRWKVKEPFFCLELCSDGPLSFTPSAAVLT